MNASQEFVNLGIPEGLIDISLSHRDSFGGMVISLVSGGQWQMGHRMSHGLSIRREDRSLSNIYLYWIRKLKIM